MPIKTVHYYYFWLGKTIQPGSIPGDTIMTYLLKKRRAEKQLFAEAQKGKKQPTEEKASRL